jgi:hypothetical protein
MAQIVTIQGNIFKRNPFKSDEINKYYRAANGYPSTSSVHEEPPTDMEEIDMARLREVTGKAVSGSLLLLLKWFKRSRKIQPVIP